jgi:hypothetical protein
VQAVVQQLDAHAVPHDRYDRVDDLHST